ncbi:MAG TPA: hypothetical protein PLV72_03500 [Candidatus Magasanikbacteria bacterium]|nr:hypothetical protein [Candidatus Magasanikbacteria bacterium]
MNQEQILDKILVKLEKMESQLDSVAIETVGTKETLNTFATKDDLMQVKSEILGDVDRFVKLHETLDQELSFLRNKYGRLEERLVVVEQKLQIV